MKGKVRRIDSKEEEIESTSRSRLDRVTKIAAKAIERCTHILVTAGAGFSADSGLPVYKDIARVEAYEKMDVDYADLCETKWMKEDPDVFYGFWGSCFNSYRKTEPHRGYDVLKRWRNLKGSDSVFVYTSNVDRHFLRVGFPQNYVYEIHGNVEEWQCSRVCQGNKIWRLSEDVRFEIDTSTMRLKRVFPDETILRCEHCGENTRPSVLMFRDDLWIKRPKREQTYVDWETEVERQLLRKMTSARLVVLEIGCGERVPHVRRESEMVVEDILRTQIGDVLEPLSSASGDEIPPYVCCILLRKDQDDDWCFLLERRDDDAEIASGQLTCFGGKVEEDEDSRDALLRELREELDWSPYSVSPVLDLYVGKRYTARFYVACAPSDAEAKESGRDAVWIKAKNLLSKSNDLNRWHRCVFRAWSRGLTRVNYEEEENDGNEIFNVPDYIRDPRAILVRVNPAEFEYTHKNRGSQHIISGIHTMSVRDTGLSFLERCEKRIVES